jgi:hypothetical protein
VESAIVVKNEADISKLMARKHPASRQCHVAVQTGEGSRSGSALSPGPSPISPGKFMLGPFSLPTTSRSTSASGAVASSSLGDDTSSSVPSTACVPPPPPPPPPAFSDALPHISVLSPSLPGKLLLLAFSSSNLISNTVHDIYVNIKKKNFSCL